MHHQSNATRWRVDAPSDASGGRTREQLSVIDPHRAQVQLIAIHTIFRRKWNPIILYYLISDGSHGFSDLKSDIDGISAKMLSDCLTDLEDERLVDRRVVEEKPVRVEYSPTDSGQALESALEELVQWGYEHFDGTENTRNA